MPSGAFTFFIATQIPEILKKYLKSKFSLTDEMTNFYMSIMTCPNCVSSLDGFWRFQINNLVTKSINLMFRSSDVEEILTFDQKIPREYYLECWVEQTKWDFRSLAERRCPVVDLLLQEDIIEERGMPDSQRSIKHMVEPHTGVVLVTADWLC